MPLPETITQIFKRKQKSYMMVLILSLIEELRASKRERVSYDRVKKRFHNYFIAEQERGNRVDLPQEKKLWREASKSRLKDIINSPVNALSHVLFVDLKDNTIGFHGQIYRQLGDEGLSQLERLANEELQAYNAALQRFSCKVIWRKSWRSTPLPKWKPSRAIQWVHCFVRPFLRNLKRYPS